MLKATHLRYTIGNNVLLTDFNLSVKAGDFVALVGPNGAGKSTALRLLGGELQPAEGTVLLEGKSLQHHPLKDLARKRACFQQNPSVDYPFTVREIAALGRHPHRDSLFDQAHDETIISAALDEAGVRHLEHRLQTTLSGGEATRAHLARTLAQEPRLLLLDEPTNHLDIHYQQEILQVCDQRRRSGCAVVAVLHDLNLAARFADHIIMLDQGKTAAQGKPGDVLTAENIQSVYDIACVVWEHPSGCPWVVPLLDSWDCPARANAAPEMPTAALA